MMRAAGLKYLLGILIAGGLGFTAVRISQRPDPPTPAPLPKQESGIAPIAESSADGPRARAAPSLAPHIPLLAPAPDPELRIQIAGAVVAPGVYSMPRDSRVQELIDKAAGITSGADLSDINIAARLVDGTVLRIPERGRSGMNSGARVLRRAPKAADLNLAFYTRSGWRRPPDQPLQTVPPGSPASPQLQPASTVLVDINTASQAELETLPGIGPVTAEKIIRFREKSPFARKEDLELVPGIGPKTMEAVEALITAN